MIFIAGHRKNLSKRYFANLIDYLTLFILILSTFFFVGRPNDDGGYSVTGFKALGIPIFWFVYFPVCESLFGQTPGKKAYGLHVVDFKGETPSVMQTFLRRMFDIFELMLFGVPALLFINHTPRNQKTRRHDSANYGRNHRRSMHLLFNGTRIVNPGGDAKFVHLSELQRVK